MNVQNYLLGGIQEENVCIEDTPGLSIGPDDSDEKEDSICCFNFFKGGNTEGMQKNNCMKLLI